MVSYFHDWTDYNGVVFSIDLLEWGRTFSGFWGEKILATVGIFCVKHGRICGKKKNCYRI